MFQSKCFDFVIYCKSTNIENCNNFIDNYSEILCNKRGIAPDGNKLYFCVEDSGHYYDTYVYTIGKSGFRKEKNNLKLIGRKGKYAIAYIHEATDVAPNRYCLYNLSSKRCQYLGEGYGIRYFGKNIYYVRSYKNMKRAQVIRCSYNGSKRKVLKTLKSSWDMIGFRFVNKHKVWYHIYRSYPYRIVNRTASF